ncbi:MAG: hypothetical protein GY851_14290 [bacterium]|nr:hypothetical protein [bacterium]
MNRVLVYPYVLTILLSASAVASEEGSIILGNPSDRADRLISIVGPRDADVVAECRPTGREAWTPATVYVGATVNAWRTRDQTTRNANIVAGRVPRGSEPCVWNYSFDFDPPLGRVQFRLRAADGGGVILDQEVDLSVCSDVVVVGCGNLDAYLGDAFEMPWRITPGAHQTPQHPNLCLPFTRDVVKPDDRYPLYRYREADAEPVVVSPGLTGWYRIYAGTEPQTSFQLSLSDEGVRYPVPEYHTARSYSRLMQDYLVVSADMTGQDVLLHPGGARYWKDVSIRYLRFVPMTDEEVQAESNARDWARAQGRPFVAYAEPCTINHYEPRSLTLRGHLGNEMRLHQKRGCTDVYVHAVRLGSKAWYRSDVLERLPIPSDEGPDGSAAKWQKWMDEGDPIVVAIEEGHAAGLKVFADMGMNVSYEKTRERAVREHPDYLLNGEGIFLDYRNPGVRDYAVVVAAELMTKYNVDGINLDYARFGCNQSFDAASLLDVGERIHRARRQAEDKWGHPIAVAARIPSYRYHEKQSRSYQGEYDEFLEALTRWAREGWVDRVMACSMGRIGYVSGLDVTRYAEAIKGTSTQLWGDLYGGGAFGNTSASGWQDVARQWVNQGLDGGFFFYTIERPIEFYQLDWQLRLTEYPEKAAVFDR